MDAISPKVAASTLVGSVWSAAKCINVNEAQFNADTQLYTPKPPGTIDGSSLLVT
jgi:hypothetical protein